MSKEKRVMEAVMFAEEKDLKIRKVMLDSNCVAIEEMPVKYYYDEPGIAEMRKEYVDNSIKIARAMEELEDFKTKIKAIVKPLQQQNQYLHVNMREGYSEVNEKTYMFDFQDLGMMGYYNEKGELVDSRRLKPTEKQTNVISMANKTANG